MLSESNWEYSRLRERRENAELTQKEVGAYLGIDQRVYSNYETGKRQIPLDLLIKLATMYETSLDYLVGLTDEKKLNRKIKIYSHHNQKNK